MNYLQKQNNTTIGLIKISLVCSFLALNKSSLGASRLDRQISVYQDLCLINAQTLERVFRIFIENLGTSKTKATEIIILLIRTLRLTTDQNTECILIDSLDHERLRQYLRKFNFFYCYYYLKYYPNNLSKLSRKKINTLGVRSLFIIHSL